MVEISVAKKVTVNLLHKISSFEEYAWTPSFTLVII